jgi:hypothetical protein
MASNQEKKRMAAAFAYMVVSIDQGEKKEATKYPVKLGAPRTPAAKLFMYAAAHSPILMDAAESAKKAFVEDSNPEKEKVYKNWEHAKYIAPVEEGNPEIEKEIQKLIKDTEHPCEEVDVDEFTGIANQLDEVSEQKDELAPMSGGGFGDLAKAAIKYVTSSCSRKPVELEVVLDDATRGLVDAAGRGPKPPSPAKSWAWMANVIGTLLASAKISSALAGSTGLSEHLSTFFNYVAEVADPAMVARNLLKSLGADVEVALSALNMSTNVLICVCLVIIFYNAVTLGKEAVVTIIGQMRQFVKTLGREGGEAAVKEQFLDLQLLMYLKGINPEMLSLASVATGAAPAAEAGAGSDVLPPPPIPALLDAPKSKPEEVVGPMDKYVKRPGRASSPSPKKTGGCPTCGHGGRRRKTRKAADPEHKKNKNKKTKAGSYRKNRKVSRKNKNRRH